MCLYVGVFVYFCVDLSVWICLCVGVDVFVYIYMRKKKMRKGEVSSFCTEKREKKCEM